MDRLAELRSQLAVAVTAMHAADEAIQAAAADADLEELRSAFDAALAEVETFKVALAHAEARKAAREANPPIQLPDPAPAAVPPAVQVGAEPLVYDRGDRSTSFFRDVVAAKFDGSGEAQERLHRHRQQMVEQRAINSTDGTGGEFIPPLWMQNEWIALARAGRPTANAVNQRPLPPNTDSINMPSVTGGTSTATQTDAGAVSSTDIVTSSVSFGVKTVAGQQDLSRQLLDRSLPGIDEILFMDLAADYATKIDVQVLNGSGSGSNALGILGTSGINTVTYTDGSPTVPELWPSFAQALSKISATRYLPPTGWVMHPRRWYWMTASVDTTGRPLIPYYAPMNPIAQLERVGAENIVGTLFGLPVLIDASVPTNLGGGTEDIILCMRFEDSWLFEDTPQTRVYEEVLSNTLQIRVQLFNYFAFTAARYPKSICTIGGTGLAAPSGF